MPRKKTVLRIEIRDKRIRGGRLSISAQTSSTVEQRKREAALRTLIEQGEYATVERIRSGDLHISDATRAVGTGKVEELRPSSREPLVLGTAVDRVLRTVEATKAPGTLRVYTQRTGDLIARFGRNRPLAEITSEEVEQYLHEPKGKAKKPWAPTTMDNVHMVGSKVWSVAIALETEAAEREGTPPRLKRNPWKGLELPEILPTRAEFLRPGEWDTVLAEAEDTPRAALLALGCLMGLRLGEALNLRPGLDLDLEKRTLTIQARKGAHPWRPKTRRSTRTLPINDALLGVLQRHIELGFVGDRYLIRLPRQDRPVSVRTAQEWTAATFRAAGIQYGQKADSLTYHNLRHTFASWLAQRGVDVLRIAKLLGDTVDQVIKTYAHLLPENLEEAAREIDRALNAARDGKKTGGVQ